MAKKEDIIPRLCARLVDTESNAAPNYSQDPTMKNEDVRLAELFSLANKMDVYGALARRLADTQRAGERDISSYAGTFKATNTDRNLERDVLHYSYGL